jgi:hypothetical protein
MNQVISDQIHCQSYHHKQIEILSYEEHPKESYQETSWIYLELRYLTRYQ